MGLGFNHIEELPSTIKHCRKLYSLQIMENDLTGLPEELADLENLSVLDLGNNRFIKIPDVIMRLTSLTHLSAPYMMLTGKKKNPHLYLHLPGKCRAKLSIVTLKY